MKASDNPFPSWLNVPSAIDGSAIGTPSAGNYKLFIGVDGNLYSKDDADVVVQLTGTGSGGSGAVSVIKPSDTSKASDTTFANDPHLIIPVDANESYIMTAVLNIDGSNAKVTVVGPASPTIAKFYDVNWNFITGNFGDVDASLADGTMLVHISLVNGANAGNVAIQWAQTASNIVASIMRKGSSITSFKIS